MTDAPVLEWAGGAVMSVATVSSSSALVLLSDAFAACVCSTVRGGTVERSASLSLVNPQPIGGRSGSYWSRGDREEEPYELVSS
jgi:hypothetical protein